MRNNNIQNKLFITHSRRRASFVASIYSRRSRKLSFQTRVKSRAITGGDAAKKVRIRRQHRVKAFFKRRRENYLYNSNN